MQVPKIQTKDRKRPMPEKSRYPVKIFATKPSVQKVASKMVLVFAVLLWRPGVTSAIVVKVIRPLIASWRGPRGSISHPEPGVQTSGSFLIKINHHHHHYHPKPRVKTGGGFQIKIRCDKIFHLVVLNGVAESLRHVMGTLLGKIR